jgi:hypothetical protein
LSRGVPEDAGYFGTGDRCIRGISFLKGKMQGDQWDLFCDAWGRIAYNAYHDENDRRLQQEEDIAEDERSYDC